MEQEYKFTVRCRAIILDQGELLVATHGTHDYCALPGGKMEWGEDVLTCMKRELIEELGIEPVIGRLCYVNSFGTPEGGYTAEFLFEILNGADYRDYEKYDRSHAFEISGLEWIKPDQAVNLKPTSVAEDFKNGTILQEKPKFIYN
ncbi:MAG: NUDIX hydrolase [Candidatus Paceibacteria bacterium]